MIEPTIAAPILLQEGMAAMIYEMDARIAAME